MRLRNALALALSLNGATACYHYVPATVAVQPQGTPLRARLVTMSEFDLSAITVNNIDLVEGELVGIDAGDVVLSATWLEAVTGNGFPGNGWTVRVPEANVTSFERKSLSWWRSGVVVGAVGVLTYLGFDALGFGNESSGGGGGGGPPL